MVFYSPFGKIIDDETYLYLIVKYLYFCIAIRMAVNLRKQTP